MVAIKEKSLLEMQIYTLKGSRGAARCDWLVPLKVCLSQATAELFFLLSDFFFEQI